MMNICSTCQGAQSECQERLDASSEYRAEVNTHLKPEQLSYEKSDGWWNKNFLWILVEEIGLDTLRERVKRPLDGLRIAPFYGCYIVRPTKRLGFDQHPEPRRVPRAADRGAGRRAGGLRRGAQVLRLPRHHHEPDHLAAPGGPPPRRRHRRRARTAS